MIALCRFFMETLDCDGRSVGSSVPAGLADTVSFSCRARPTRLPGGPLAPDATRDDPLRSLEVALNLGSRRGSLQLICQRLWDAPLVDRIEEGTE